MASRAIESYKNTQDFKNEVGEAARARTGLGQIGPHPYLSLIRKKSLASG